MHLLARKEGAQCELCQEIVFRSMAQHLKLECRGRFPCTTCGASFHLSRELDDHLALGHVILLEH